MAVGLVVIVVVSHVAALAVDVDGGLRADAGRPAQLGGDATLADDGADVALIGWRPGTPTLSLHCCGDVFDVVGGVGAGGDVESDLQPPFIWRITLVVARGEFESRFDTLQLGGLYDLSTQGDDLSLGLVVR